MRTGAAPGRPAARQNGTRRAADGEPVQGQTVRGGDEPRVGLEAALRGDHRGELGSHVDVRHLEHTCDGGTELAGGRTVERGSGLRRRLPAVVRHALEAGLVGELRQREVASGSAAVGADRRKCRGLRVARRRDEAHRAVRGDGDVRRTLRDLDVAVGYAAAAGVVRADLAHDVVAVGGDEEALVVAVEVAGTGVVDLGAGRHGCRRVARGGRARAVADADPTLALDGNVERAARDLERTGPHHVADRADVHAEADLLGVRPAVAGARCGTGADELGEGILERRAARFVADRIDVRQVVGGDVEKDLVSLETALGGEHRTHHRDIVSLCVRPPLRGPAWVDMWGGAPGAADFVPSAPST